MQGTKVDTLIALIQWRVDEGIPLKDAYNTVVRNFHEGVTEDERQQLIEHFIPIEDTTMTTAQHITHIRTLTSDQATDYMVSLDRSELEAVATALNIVSLISRSELVEYATDALSYN